MNDSYETARKSYMPKRVKVLFIAESPPPEAATDSSRHFYRAEKNRRNDRLFVNTIKALYKDAANLTEAQIEPDKKQWLERFASDGYFMIEALEQSQQHEVSRKDRQLRIKQSLPRLLERVAQHASKDTRIILIKSNVYDVAATPLRDAGFTILNEQLVDYPGRFNQKAYREKLQELLKIY